MNDTGLDTHPGTPVPPPAIPGVDRWLETRRDGAISSNVGSYGIAFQNWFRFKEAYSPKLVLDVLADVPRPVKACIDPTGGSGTTALTCSFMGIDAQTVEVNPFMADLIRAKTGDHDLASLDADLQAVLAFDGTTDDGWLEGAPKTLVEPGADGLRWVYGAGVAASIGSLSTAIETVAGPEHRPFLRVMLGSVLKDVSNVIVNGKGRKYRRGWQDRTVEPSKVDTGFEAACRSAFEDMRLHSAARIGRTVVHHADARTAISGLDEADCAIFSPPYPNSFDYTDIYNLELWMLGYLRTPADNRDLRLSTMQSHVQITRQTRRPVGISILLGATLDRIDRIRGSLWHRGIPAMLESYFADLEGMVLDLAGRMRPGGTVSCVVGGSSYAGVAVDVGAVIEDLILSHGLTLRSRRSLRSMRLSAQQGGMPGLSEDLVTFVV